MPPFRFTTPVRFADVDHAGIVYYPTFFHYFHLALEEFLCARLGPKGYVELLDGEKVGFPAVRSECDFRSPLRFGDTIEVALTTERIGGKSMTFGYRVTRVSDDEVAAEGHVVVVVTDLEHFRSVDIPETLRTLFLELRPDPR